MPGPTVTLLCGAPISASVTPVAAAIAPPMTSAEFGPFSTPHSFP